LCETADSDIIVQLLSSSVTVMLSCCKFVISNWWRLQRMTSPMAWRQNPKNAKFRVRRYGYREITLTSTDRIPL